MPTPVSPTPPLPPTTTPSTPAQQIIPNTGMSLDMNTVVLGITGLLVLVAIILLTVYIIVKKRSGTTKYSVVNKLAKALNDPNTDAVGIIVNGDTGTIDIVGLEKIENTYISTDPEYPRLIFDNPMAPVYSIHGKPVIIATTFGRAGVPIDPYDLTAIGLSFLALESDLYGYEAEPTKAYELLLKKILSHVGELQGKIEIAPGMKLAMRMNPIRITHALLRVATALGLSTMNAMSDSTKIIDSVSERLKEKKIQEMAIKQRYIIYIAIGASMAALIGSLAYYLATMGH